MRHDTTFGQGGHLKALRALLGVMFVVGGLASCSGDDDVRGVSGGADTTDEQPADPVGDQSAAVPDDLSGELLGPGDLEGEWDSPGGPLRSELLEGADSPLGPFCPDGVTVAVSAETLALSERGNAEIELAAADEDSDDTVDEVLHHDPDGELFDAFRAMFDSCVAQTWEEGDDPVENVRLEAVELDPVGDDAVAYRELWGSSGEFYGTDLYAFVRTGGVAMLLTVRTEDAEGGGDELFRAAVAAAVARLEDGTSNPGVLDAPVAPEHEEAADIQVTAPGEITVRGNSGCELHGNDSSYVVDNVDDVSDELPPNILWFIEQVFDVHDKSSLQVWADRVTVEVFVRFDETGIELADLTATEQVAVELGERLGNRSICH